MKKVSKEISLFKREMYAVFFLGLGIFFYLSLFSYHSLDPSFLSHNTGRVIHNWGGIFGAYLSDSLIFLFGLASYCIGVFFIFISLLFFKGTISSLRTHQIPVYFLFIIFLSVLFQLLVQKVRLGEASIEAGGLLGSLLASGGEEYLGRPGTYLLVLVGAILTFIWATRFSLREMGDFFFTRSAAFIKTTGQLIQIYWARVKKMISKWRVKEIALPAQEVKINRTALLEKTTLELSARPKPLASGEPKIFDRIDKTKTAKPQTSQLEFQNLSKNYTFPSLNLLDTEAHETITVDEESLKMNARLLEKKLGDFDVQGLVTEIHPGPVITMYEFQPAPGVKLSRIANLVDDLSMAMGGRSVRIVAPLPNKPAVGIEIPNNTRETVWLKEVIADDKFQKSEAKLMLALGKNIEGTPFIADLAKMPHLLVAGATGSGKSVSINSMILSILYKASPDDVRLLMVDPKMLELSIYEGIPHLLLPVVTEPKKASLALRWAVREMERRYHLMSDINARDILSYNKKVASGNFVSKSAGRGEEITGGSEEPVIHEGKIPYIVVLIDELADLMMVSSREVEESITRLAQMARAAGIHLILATQRPSVDVLTGVIKANFPARISFKVSSKYDARTILDTIGAERLLGAGDMLFIPPGTSRMVRVHGTYITDAEISRVVDHLKKQGKPIYNESILKPVETEGVEGLEGSEGEADVLYDQAVAIVAETKQASISMIQRKLRVGYNRAARMIEKMELEGIVSAPSGSGQRQVLVSSYSEP